MTSAYPDLNELRAEHAKLSAEREAETDPAMQYELTGQLESLESAIGEAEIALEAAGLDESMIVPGLRPLGERG